MYILRAIIHKYKLRHKTHTYHCSRFCARTPNEINPIHIKRRDRKALHMLVFFRVCQIRLYKLCPLVESFSWSALYVSEQHWIRRECPEVHYILSVDVLGNSARHFLMRRSRLWKTLQLTDQVFKKHAQLTFGYFTPGKLSKYHYVFHFDIRGFILAICVRDESSRRRHSVSKWWRYNRILGAQPVSRYDENIVIVKNTIYAQLSAP